MVISLASSATVYTFANLQAVSRCVPETNLQIPALVGKQTLSQALGQILRESSSLLQAASSGKLKISPECN